MACGARVEVTETYWPVCWKWFVSYPCKKSRTVTRFRYDFIPWRSRITHMRLLKTLVTVMAVTAIAACSTTATLYPVDGPLSKQQPLPVLTAAVDGIMGNTGGISLSLPDGERCTGKWSSIAPMSVGFSTATASGSARNGMASVWTTVYGSGLSMRNLPGVNKGEAMLVGNRGTVIQVEFYTGSGTANGTGVAKDNKGNVFKVLF